ncbi:uncharacterized protein Z519_12564 [Cladophialophora bantiana CBS 173.52]|uniref:MmgE/PrpD family protein n=1 Tax=Cladophialophora bantiana (strain ATCC 10958 / CBS 173.52 / CDC B-1940 / NIH 8579) TaxID=1442370 RepID=A0A0D2H0H2_CLAB1|nr:uncharacterized protein Z519_12564 [Cladophialophora bantiana CBS 173.52]KIW86778.1 hypothetical protein Z519_12564 [Cladophialophora bantiana CBS 173.52]
MATNGDSKHPASLTRLAARRIRQIATEELSQQLYDKATFCIIDWLGAVHTGLLLPWKDALVKYAKLNRGIAEAYAWGIDGDVSTETAAFVNATLAHSAIRDDMHLEACSHIGSIVISAALALAQRERWSGEKLLRAIIAGYEMAALLGSAIRHRGNFNAHFRPSGLIGAFGVTAAAIAAEGVEESVAVNALGFAVSMAAGTNEWAWSGGTEIFVEMGVASRSGIASFDLANAGFESSDTALEGKDGFFNALGVGPAGAEDFKDWIEKSPIGKGVLDVRFKPVAGCNYAQTTSAVAVRIYHKHKLGEIDRIKITATTQAVKYPGCDNAGPLNTIQNTKMSIQFGVCAALSFGKLDEDIFKCCDDKQVNELISKCELNASSEYDKMYVRGLQPAMVEVTLADGTVLRESAEDVPWLTESDVEARSISEQARDISKDAAVKVVEACKGLRDLAQGDELLVHLRSRR